MVLGIEGEHLKHQNETRYWCLWERDAVEDLQANKGSAPTATCQHYPESLWWSCYTTHREGCIGLLNNQAPATPSVLHH